MRKSALTPLVEEDSTILKQVREGTVMSGINEGSTLLEFADFGVNTSMKSLKTNESPGTLTSLQENPYGTGLLNTGSSEFQISTKQLKKGLEQNIKNI